MVFFTSIGFIHGLDFIRQQDDEHSFCLINVISTSLLSQSDVSYMIIAHMSIFEGGGCISGTDKRNMTPF